MLAFYTQDMWWWKQRIHVSWNIALACAGFVGGVALSLVVRSTFFWGCMGAFVAIACIMYGRVLTLPLLLLGCLVVGLSYGSAHLGERGVYDEMIGRVLNVKGRVREDPSKAASGSTSLQLDTVMINGVAMPGSVFMSVRSVPGVKRGDIVEGTGEAKAGFANFPISFSLTKLDRVGRSRYGDVGRVVRDWFADKVRVVIPEPQASLGIGFLTGQKSALPSDVADSLKVAGLTHIVVASGYNLTILVRLARKVLLRVSKFLSAVSSSFMILAFVAITGLSPSMTRAGLVSGMSLLSWYYGHAFHPFVLLPVAAAITTALQPSYVWGDLGWRLSFSAFAGVMVVAPLIQAYFFGRAPPGVFRQILGETVAAHLVTIPVIALSFGVISNVAIIANLLVVPLVPLAMLLTFICGMGVVIGAPFISVVATPTSWLLEYMVGVARFVSEIPWAQSELGLPPVVWGLYILVLCGVCYWMWRGSHYSFRGGAEGGVI